MEVSVENSEPLSPLEAYQRLQDEWKRLYEERRAQEIADDRISQWLENGGRELLQQVSLANQEHHDAKKAAKKKKWNKIGHIAVKSLACVATAGVILLVPPAAAFGWGILFNAIANLDQVAELWNPPNPKPDLEGIDLKKVFDEMRKIPDNLLD